jgi:hypothetical protein
MIEVRIIDRERVVSAVNQLKDIDKDKAVKKGLGDAGRVFATGGKRRLKSRMISGPTGVTGNLLRSFQIRVKKSKPGVLIGFTRGVNGGNHVHLVDRGTNKRYWITRGRKYVGKVKANRFWSDTEAQDYPHAVDKLYEGVERAVIRIQNRN